jgi:Flp pilus assembly protein TadG
LRRDRSGIAATEFALVLPLLVALWLGMAQLIQLSMASAKTSLAAQSVADLVSRYTSSGYADPSGFSDLEAAADTIIAPLPTSADNPSISIVSVTLNASGSATQAWHCTSGNNQPTAQQLAAAIAQAPGLTTSSSSLTSMIIVTVIYSYTPTITGGVLGPQTFVTSAYGTPRTVSTVPNPC